MLPDMTVPTRPGGPTPPAGFEVEAPDVSQIVIDDGAPVDSVLSEKQMRLLTEPLYSSWLGPPEQEEGERRPFLAAANVGLFSTPHDPPLVPDVFLSLDVEAHPDLWKEKKHRSYFFWEFGKPPDVAIEIVSNREGDELTRKKRGYARMRILYYAVWDPLGMLAAPALHRFELRGDLYVPLAAAWFPSVGLGLSEWRGRFEHTEGEWIRWRREDGALVPTGAERAASAEARAVGAEARAVGAEARAESAEARAQQLAARLRELGVEPDDA
jgi:Uma2 family endonuclease